MLLDGRALRAAVSGKVVTWGSNDYGALFVPVGAQSGVTAISAGPIHTLALKDDGTVVARGLTIFLGSGYPELDAAAVLFILKHHFNPAQCDGKPTSSAHNYQVKFELPKPQQ